MTFYTEDGTEVMVFFADDGTVNVVVDHEEIEEDGEMGISFQSLCQDYFNMYKDEPTRDESIRSLIANFRYFADILEIEISGKAGDDGMRI